MTVLRVKERAVGKTVPLKAIGIYIYIYMEFIDVPKVFQKVPST